MKFPSPYIYSLNIICSANAIDLLITPRGENNVLCVIYIYACPYIGEVRTVKSEPAIALDRHS